jgi:ring-1,2-phenylacetyl-CoA epoxidase subunit PaaE
MSTPKFYTLSVSDIRKETGNCVSVALDIPEALKNDFKYEAGQYITFKKVIDGEELRRSYSLCSSPDDQEFRVAIKKVLGGKFSGYANHDLKVGDELEVMTPMGHFTTDIKPDECKHYMAFAAGSGITPMLSLIKTILKRSPQSTFTLVYGNQNFYSIIFREEIEALKNRYLNRLQVFHVLSRERMETDLNNGRINAQKCDQLFAKLIDLKQMDQFFMCGPEEMILSVRDYLLDKGVEKEKIKFELFHTAGAAKKQNNELGQGEEASNVKMSMVTIKADDRSVEIPLAYNGMSILDAALKAGADLPFACKGGVCCTCRAKVIEGRVNMEVNYALETDEVEAGFVLTCQAHPLSEKVVIDFDAR